MDKNFYIKNGKEYIFKIILVNNDTPNETTVFEFNPNMVEDLVIEESLFQWYTQGNMTYINYDEGLERGGRSALDPFNTEDTFLYKYRFDCYDTLIISIQPLNLDPADDPNEFLLEYKFAIYDVQDIPAKDNEKKRKKIYFWDIDYQFMLDKNVAWSSIMHPKFSELSKYQISQLTNYQRSIQVSELLELFLEHENICNFVNRIDRDNWRYTAINHLMFYTSPSQNFLSDDLDTLISNAIASDQYDYSPMIFSKDRAPKTKENGKFTLLPLSEYYERSQTDLFMENMFIQYKGYNQAIPLKSPKYKSYQESVILSYQYAQSAGIDNSRAYQIKPQTNYNHGSGQFNWDSAWHTPSVAKKFVANNMTKHLKALGENPEKNTLVLLNQYKKSKSYTLTPEYSDQPTREGRLATGRNKLISSMVQLNDTINFVARGLTFRRPGRFIGIDLLYGHDNMDFDNRLMGQWLVAEVKHVFRSAEYFNEMTCIKIHTYQNLRPLVEDLDPDALNVEGWPERR